MKSLSTLMGALTVGMCLAVTGTAQSVNSSPASEIQLRSGPELEQLLAPIALYPDPLLALLLPAATFPSEIVLASRYLATGGDPYLADQQDWDPSVQAMVHYPEVLRWLDENLAWTMAVGQAFLAQPQDVMIAIQRLRAMAQSSGNLYSTPEEMVFVENGIIEILPADPAVIYLPVYQPDVVYAQRCYGSPFISFGAGLRTGPWLNHDFDWPRRHIIVWHHDNPRPSNWWCRPSDRPGLQTVRHAVWRRGRPVEFVPFEPGASPAAAPPQSTVTVIGERSRGVVRVVSGSSDSSPNAVETRTSASSTQSSKVSSRGNHGQHQRGSTSPGNGGRANRQSGSIGASASRTASAPAARTSSRPAPAPRPRP